MLKLDHIALNKSENQGSGTQFVNTSDDFRFGASKPFRATYTATVLIEVDGKQFAVRAAVVDGEIPTPQPKSFEQTRNGVGRSREYSQVQTPQCR